MGQFKLGGLIHFCKIVAILSKIYTSIYRGSSISLLKLRSKSWFYCAINGAVSWCYVCMRVNNCIIYKPRHKGSLSRAVFPVGTGLVSFSSPSSFLLSQTYRLCSVGALV